MRQCSGSAGTERLVCRRVGSFSGNIIVLKESHHCLSQPSNEQSLTGIDMMVDHRCSVPIDTSANTQGRDSWELAALSHFHVDEAFHPIWKDAAAPAVGLPLLSLIAWGHSCQEVPVSLRLWLWGVRFCSEALANSLSLKLIKSQLSWK